MGRGGVYRLMLGHTDDKSKSYKSWSWVRPEPNLGSLFLGARITARSTKNAHDPQSWIRATLRHPAIEALSNDWIARLIACSYPALCPTRAGAQDVPGRRPGMVFSTSSLPPPKANSTSLTDASRLCPVMAPHQYLTRLTTTRANRDPDRAGLNG